MISITTAGYDRESICYEQHEYARGVLEGRIVDSGFLGVIKAAAPEDDWTDPEVWRRANPSYGITIRPDQFEADCREAQQSPRKESAFKRYRLNQWVGHADCWLSSSIWELGAEPFDPRFLEGKECFVGVDLARRRDVAAVVLVFKVDDSFYLLPRFFLPEGCLAERERHDHVSYSVWARQGLLTLTPGDVIDYRFIRQQINDDSKRYSIQQIGYDPWNAELLCNQQLGQEDGFDAVEVRQAIAVMGPATAEFEKLLRRAAKAWWPPDPRLDGRQLRGATGCQRQHHAQQEAEHQPDRRDRGGDHWAQPGHAAARVQLGNLLLRDRDMGHKSRQTLVAARRRQQVASLYLQGWPQTEIADHLKIAQSTVSSDLKRIQTDWRRSTIRDFDLLQTIELKKIDRIEREAWAAWDRSQKPSQQARIKGNRSEQDAERLVKNQVGDPRFLEQVQKCVAARRALMGLDAPTRIEPVGQFVMPLTTEQRMAHIMAIMGEVEQRKLNAGADR